MQSWWSYLAALACATGVRGTLEFPQGGANCPRPDQKCVSIQTCAEYQTRAELLRHRPTPCAFSGMPPLVCCSAAERPVTSAPPTGLHSPLPDQCGRRRSQTDGAELIGGVNAQLDKWPWMVLFGRWTEDGLGKWFCGGVLITDRHVLTAAHCLRPEEAGRVGARIGDNDLTISGEVDHQERNVSRIVRHPEYRGSQNDLAVVRLAAPVELTEDVRPICLPPAGAEHDGKDVEMAGWGLLESNGEPSDILQEVALRVTDPAACEAAYRRVPRFEASFPGGFQGTKVCAGSRDGVPRDACEGDSGGPLMVFQLGEYQLVGIASGGIGCGSPDFPGVYSKVSAYIDWIVSQLK